LLTLTAVSFGQQISVAWNSNKAKLVTKLALSFKESLPTILKIKKIIRREKRLIIFLTGLP
jgi:hypothetical protein